jgi:hypothetical protein
VFLKVPQRINDEHRNIVVLKASNVSETTYSDDNFTFTVTPTEIINI